MSRLTRRLFVPIALMPVVLASQRGASAQESPYFAPGNIVVSVEGCGVSGGTCTSIPNGTGNGTGNSSDTGYGDNQAAPLTLFQYAPNGVSSATFVNSLVIPQSGSGANLPVSGEYGSSSEGTLQLSSPGQYLTIMGYGVNANTFNADPGSFSLSSTSAALAQSSSLTGQSYTPVPRVVTTVDAYGNVNTSTVLYNVFDGNNPRSTYSVDGLNFYVSGQGTSGDATGRVFLTTLGATNDAPTSITGDDAGTNESQDTRTVQVFDDTLYVSVDSKEGADNRDFIGTLGTPPATTVFVPGTQGDGYTTGPMQLSGFGNNGQIPRPENGTQTGTQYSGPVTISSTTALSAFAVAPDGTTSLPIQANYVITQ